MSPVPERAAAPVPAERADGPDASSLDLRILTPGLTDEEIAAVTSVVAAAIEAQRELSEDGRESPATVNARRWRRSVGLLAGAGAFGPAR